jgi:hypothetical protein
MTLKVWIATAALAAGIAVGAPAPAAANESDYLRLKDTLNYLTTQQLLSEGYKVCGAIRNGMRSPDAVNLVTKDLAVGVDDALDIVSVAVVELSC